MPELLKAPPLPLNFAPETVTPEIERFPLEAMLKMLKSRLLTPLSPLIVSAEAPRPLMVKVPEIDALRMVGNAEAVRVIV